MNIGVGGDHGGYELKTEIAAYLTSLGHEVTDYGSHSGARVDYPEYGRVVGEAVAAGHVDLGIAICGSGVGISVAANKVRGVRCSCVSEPYSARLARLHNDANVLAMGGRVVGVELAKMIVDEFIGTKPEGGRHAERREQLAALDAAR